MACGRRDGRGPSARRAATAAGVALALALGGCGGDDGGDEASGPLLTIEAIPTPSKTGPEADRIRRAFAALDAADLEARNRRDATAACEQLECFTRIASDEVTITAWADSDTAARASEHHVGTLGVTFVSSRVTRDEQAAYLEAIRGASAGAARPDRAPGGELRIR